MSVRVVHVGHVLCLEMSVVHGLRGVGGECEMCMYLARNGAGGEGVSG